MSSYSSGGEAVRFQSDGPRGFDCLMFCVCGFQWLERTPLAQTFISLTEATTLGTLQGISLLPVHQCGLCEV